MTATDVETYRFSHVTKQYSGIVALDDVSVEIQKGEVHGLIGKNGAGKSTLANIISGAISPTEGEMIFRGTEVDKSKYNPKSAKSLGVGLVPQKPTIATELSVSDYLFIGSWPQKQLRLVDQLKMNKKALEIIERLQLDTSLTPTTKMGNFSVEAQQMLTLGKLLFLEESSLILLDEVTSYTDYEKKELLFDFVREQRDKGNTFIFISHRLGEIVELCDRVTVLRDGKKVATVDKSQMDKAELSKLIVGKAPVETESLFEGKKFGKKTGEPLLTVQQMDLRGKNVNFTLHKGEILGFAGLRGSGKSLTLRALFGLLPVDQYQITLNDQELKLKGPIEAIKQGLAYLTSEREKEGMIPMQSVGINLTISILDFLTSDVGAVKRTTFDSLVNRNVKSLDIKCSSIREAVESLSGGNKQKVLLGRIMNIEPTIYLFDQPTAGVDVGVKPEILRAIREKAVGEEKGAILTSSDIGELMTVSDRILVFYEGQVVSEYSRDQFSEQEIYEKVQGVENGGNNEVLA